ncbi:MAG: efflux RND transporter periplasmic adaptor subunit [Vicinamibacterales bacterium]
MKAVSVCIVLGLCVSACGRNRQEVPPAGNVESAAPTENHALEQGVVRISDEMLRDLRVTTAPVEEHRGASSASMLGELSVNENTYAEVSVPLRAQVVRLSAVLGQSVRTGDALATLQSGDLARARSEIATATSRVNLARQTFERRKALNAERIVPTREVQEAESELQSAEAAAAAARASLLALTGQDDSPGNANEFTLRAPLGGVIVERAAVLGQVVDPEKPIFKIANLSTVWLTVHAFERDAVRLRQGETARITFAAIPGQTFQGTVSFIGRTVESESRTVPVRIDLPNAEGRLRPGMSATAWLPVGNEQGVLLAVPAAALQRVRDRWCVFVPKDASSFEIRPVGRGRDLAGEVEIVSGLRTGEMVVVDGAFLLKAETEKSASEHEEH